jgi:hypothetical protein
MQKGASVLDIQHERAWVFTDIMSVSIRMVMETRSREHADELHRALLETNYKCVVIAVARRTVGQAHSGVWGGGGGLCAGRVDWMA